MIGKKADTNLNTDNLVQIPTCLGIAKYIKFNFFSGVLQYVSYNWSEIITEIWVFGTGYQSLKVIYGGNISWSLIPSYPNCQYIDLVDYIDLRTFTPFKVQKTISVGLKISFSQFLESDRGSIIQFIPRLCRSSLRVTLIKSLFTY